MNARSKMHIILLPPTWWQVLLELHHRRSHLQVQPWELNRHERKRNHPLVVALLLVYGAVISRAPYVSSMCEAQRETCSPVIQPAGWNYSAKLLQIDTFMSLPRGISE